MEKKYWFKAKQYGWGWYPATWQGWAILAMYIFAALTTSFFIDSQQYSTSDFLMGFFPTIYILTVFLVIICYKTGEKPGWRWGKAKDEMVEVFNEQGENTGKIVSKDDAHKKGYWHTAGAVWIRNPKGELLIQLRAATKTNSPNKWDTSAAGHTSAGETVITSALRELKEELGLTISPAELICLGVVRDADILNNGTFLDNEFDSVYLLEKDIDINTLQLQKSEVAEVRWISVDELKEKIYSHNFAFCPRPAEFAMLFEFLDRKYGSSKK